MSYSVKILKNEDYDELPYARIRESFAVTSPDNRNIYVRYTNAHDFNKMLIDHEMNHLVEEVPTDVGPDGERYFLSSLIGGLGNLLGSKGLMGILGTVGKGLLGGLGKIGSGAMNLFSSSPGSISGLPGSSTPKSSGGLLNSLFSGVSGLLGGSNKYSLGSVLSNPQTLLGGTMLGIGLGKNYPTPNFNSAALEQLKGMASGGGSPVGQLAQSKLTEQLGQTFDPLSEEEIQAALRQIQKEKELALDKVNDTYKNLRPGSDYSTDTAWKKDVEDVNQSYGQLEADTLANRTRELKSIFNTQRTAQIQQALGASESQMQQLQQIAQLNIIEIMSKLNLDYEKASQFKQTFQDLGMGLLLDAFQI